jgi:hypothetical protein
MTAKHIASSLPFGARSFFGPSARLFAPDDGGPGSAGGGAGGAGNTGAGGDDDKPLTAAEITDLVSKTVNQALSSKLAKSVQTAVQAALTPAIDGLKAEFAKAKPPVGGADDDPPDAGGKPKKGDAETERLRSELETLKAQQRKIVEDAAAATKKAQNDRALAALTRELTPFASSPEVAAVVAKNMLFVDNKVDFDENGDPLYKHRREAYKGGPLEDVALDIKDGIAAWAATKDAEAFVKAPQAGGPRQANGAAFAKRGTTNPLKLTDPGGLEAEAASITAELEQRGHRL